MSREDSARILIIPITFFFIFFGLGSIQPYVIPFLKLKWKFSSLQCSVIMAVIYFSFGLFRFCAPLIIYYLRSKPTIFLGASGYLLFVVLLYTLEQYPAFIAASAMWGLFAAMFWTASSIQILDTSEITRYGTWSGVLYFFTKSGVALGVPFLGFVWSLNGRADAFAGYQDLFRISILVGSIGIALALFVPRLQVEQRKPLLGDVRKFLFHRGGWIILLLLIVPGMSYGNLLGLINVYIKETFDESYVGPITFFYLATGVLFSYLGGRLSDRFGRRRVFLGSFASGALGALIMAFTAQPILLGLANFLLGVQFGAIPVAAMAWVGDITARGGRPLAHGSVFAGRDLGVGASIMISGSFSQLQIGYQETFLTFTAIFLAAALLSYAYIREPIREGDPK